MNRIPVVVFAYARPDHLERALASLRANQVPLIEAFADGAKGEHDAAAVASARARLRAVDWCEIKIVERPQNMGLGANVLAGVTDVAARHEAFIVWEDDLICVPGAYIWLAAALRHYAAQTAVMSVTAWTHPRITPPDVGSSAWFDGRAECWAWGTWARAWRGMTDETAVEKAAVAGARGRGEGSFGDDLRIMAREEQRKNTWAVRWLYHHLQHGGLCLRPPWSMVEHIGFDQTATNAQAAIAWQNPPLRPAPPMPNGWPTPKLHPACRALWRRATSSGWRGWWPKLRARLSQT